MKTDAEISRLWQFAHSKFHFGEKLAVHAMLGVAGPAMESGVIRSAKNQTQVDDHPAPLGKSAAGSVEYAARSAEAGTAGKIVWNSTKILPLPKNPTFRPELHEAPENPGPSCSGGWGYRLFVLLAANWPQLRCRRHDSQPLPSASMFV